MASVAITSPGAPPTIGALGHTVQFTAVAKDGGGATIAGATIGWNSSNTAVATVSASGLVTAVSNGATSITASSGGQASTGVTVTVSQVPLLASITPSQVSFGAIGSTRQLTATLLDSANAAIAGAPAAVWVNAPSGKTSVNATGMVTAVGVTTAGADTIQAKFTVGATQFIAVSVVSVSQVLASITVAATSPGPDTLKTTGSTRQYAATAKDSNANTIAGTNVTWTSTTTAAATVGAASGLATAVADGNTNITATSGTISGFKTLVVRRYPATFTITPAPTATITTNGGTQIFNGTAQDSNANNLTISWTSRTLGVATLNPATGTQTTATAVGNGTSYIVISAGGRSDSSQLTVSGQTAAPSAIAVQIGDNFFKSGRNATQNPAVDTVAIGGTVTWTWSGAFNHSVESILSPSFTSSTVKSTGNYPLVFNTAGTYQYDCSVHGAAMSGRIVVR